MLKRVFISMFAAAGLVAAPYASAEIQGYVSGGLGFNAVTSDVVIDGVLGGNPPVPEPTAYSTAGKSNLTGQIEGGARFALPDDNIIFGVGLYINPFTMKADDVNNAGFTSSAEIVDMRGLVGEIGWKLGASTVAYGKLSLNQGRVELLIADNAPAVTLTQDFSGVGLGAGIRQSLENNMYLFADWHHIVGSKVTFNTGEIDGIHKITPKLTTGMVGAGLTF